jgi:hypothetical protein
METHVINQTRGIAIVTVLLIMMAVLILGAGAMFLTRTNLTVSSNVNRNALAEAHANAGLDVALYVLQRAYRQSINPLTGEGSFPATGTLTLGTATGVGFSPTYSLASYTRDATNPGVAHVAVRGTGPLNAEHVAEALVQMFPGQPEFPPGFGFGLASMGVINVNGSSTYINAGIHGNSGFNLTGNVSEDFFICVERNSSGLCVKTEVIPLADAPVSASPGASQCAPAVLCTNGTPNTLVSPITVDPNYVTKRRAAVEDADSGTGTAAVVFDGVSIQCDYVVASQTQLADLLATGPLRAGRTLCSTGSAQITFPANFDTGGMHIISQGPVHFRRSGDNQPTFRNSIIVTHAGSVTTDNERATIMSSRVFSEGNINFNGSQTRISGISTLASNGSIVVDGGAPAVTGTDERAVGFAIVASGNVTINGSSAWYVAATVGGTFTQNGNAWVYGVVEAVNTITINGGIDIDSGLPIVAKDLEQDGPPRIGVVARR